MKVLVSILLIAVSTITYSYGQEKLKEGDIVLQKIPCGSLCEAIIETTPCEPDRMFNHCGVIHFDSGRVYVIEAIGKEVKQSRLEVFLNRDSVSKTLYVARLKPQYASYLQPAMRKAIHYVGTPYDDAFLPGDDALYCSELVYRIFKKDNTPYLFPLSPMTFKSKSGKTFPAWTEYYKDLKQPIPEGQPGINPCSIANSGAVEMITIDVK